MMYTAVSQHRSLFNCCHAIYLFWTLLLLVLSAIHVNSLSADGLSLLQIKASFLSDPLGLFSNWNKDDENPCSWTGVTCDTRTLRVVSLNITGEAAFCSSWNSGVPCTDDSCNPFQSCPSSLLHSLDQPCYQTTDALKVCLKNGTVLVVSAEYNKQDRIPCRVTGSISPAIRNLTLLRMLVIPYNGLSGYLPKEIGELKSLEILDARGNSFSGRIPPKIGRLPHLRVLNLAFNSFEGEIPSQLSGCTSLSYLNLAGNLLSGKIPAFIGNFSALQSLILSYNQLDGTIPDEVIGSCDKLERLHLDGNFLFGTIPSSLGNCTNLISLTVSSNFLSAPIPAELGKLSKLESLDVSRNSLAGIIPPELGNCTQLSLLVLTNLLYVETCINRILIDPIDGYTSKDKGEYNYFTGALPASVTSLPLLRLLWAPRAGFLANFPKQWGVCANLEILNLGQNSFSGSIPRGLTRCKNLIYLDISFNALEGHIPQKLGVPCMVVFNVSGNSLSGNVTSIDDKNCPTVELLLDHSTANTLYMSSYNQSSSVNTVYSYSTSLYYGSVVSSLPVGFLPQPVMVIHDLSQNNLTGKVPGPLLGTNLSNRKPLYGILLSRNQYHGKISDHIFTNCMSYQGFAIDLSHNLLHGALPINSMVSCNSLTHFGAATNHLGGSIQPEIQALKKLVYLDLGTNDLHGRIPPELGQLQQLQYLILNNNSLVGTIPASLGNLTFLVELGLAENKLTGEIPKELTNLNNLQYLWLNNNTLSGNIPQGFGNLTSLTNFNVAYNNLSGTVPDINGIGSSCDEASFAGNPYLKICFAVAPAPSSESVVIPRPLVMSPSNTIVRSKSQVGWWKFVVIIASLIVFIPLLPLLCCCIKRQCHGRSSKQKEVVLFVNIGFRLTYENIVRATGNFSVDNLIGNGGFGATYKAEPAPGYLVAVKKLYIGRVQGMQQFVAEIRTLGRIRHPHLVTLVGYYAHDSEMFLIYNYLSGGNLESLLHDREKGSIPWKVRHKIALNVAQALEYLHNRCHPRVLHRDIKPSNILLDTSMNAYLSDFGLARLLGASETHATTDVAGTFGYVAPEYATTGRVSDKADVYSYGVVLLELLSGKKALDPSFSEHGDGFNIVAWASQLYKTGQCEAVFPPGLWDQGPHSELIDALKLAIICTDESLAERPTMNQVVDHLKLCRLTLSFSL